mgnify:FL=1
MRERSCLCVLRAARLSISINYELSKYEREFSDFKEKQREGDVCILQLNIFMIYVKGMETQIIY